MLRNDNLDYYLTLQKEFGFRYLPGNQVKIQTKEGIRPDKICAPCYPDYNGRTRYNGFFTDNGSDEGFIEIRDYDTWKINLIGLFWHLAKSIIFSSFFFCIWSIPILPIVYCSYYSPKVSKFR